MTTPFKNTETRTFALALLKAALERHQTGEETWTTDIVPDTVRGLGRGTAGSVIELLRSHKVIEPVGLQVNGRWYQEMWKSARPCANNRRICVHRLASRRAAEEFLKENEQQA